MSRKIVNKFARNPIKLLKEQKEFALKVVQLKALAGQLELWETMQALKVAMKTIGWELERKINGKA